MSLDFLFINLQEKRSIRPDSGKIRNRISGKNMTGYPLKLEKALSGGRIYGKTNIRPNPIKKKDFKKVLTHVCIKCASSLNFLQFRSDPDPLFHETDPNPYQKSK